MHPEQACIALRAHEHREAFFPLDADSALRVTLQQPKLLCSSQLAETCPTPPDAAGGVLVGESEPLTFTDVNTPRTPRRTAHGSSFSCSCGTRRDGSAAQVQQDQDDELIAETYSEKPACPRTPC